MKPHASPAWLVAVAAALFGLLFASMATAQSDDAKSEAKAAFERGLGHAKDGSWDAALAEFLRSRELYPTRFNTQNAALALKELERYGEALMLLDALEAEFPEAQGDPAVDKARAELTPHVGRVDVKNAPKQSSVVVDGRSVGSLPLEHPLWVDEGEHRLQVFSDDDELYDDEIVVRAGKRHEVEVRRLAPRDVAETPEPTPEDTDTVSADLPLGWWVAPGAHVVLMRNLGGDLGSRCTPASCGFQPGFLGVIEAGRWLGPGFAVSAELSYLGISTERSGQTASPPSSQSMKMAGLGVGVSYRSQERTHGIASASAGWMVGDFDVTFGADYADFTVQMPYLALELWAAFQATDHWAIRAGARVMALVTPVPIFDRQGDNWSTMDDVLWMVTPGVSASYAF